MPSDDNGRAPHDCDFHPDSYRSYLRVLASGHCARALVGKLDASDLAQESLMHAVRAQQQFRGKSSGEYRAWLRQILENVILGKLRHFSTEARQIDRERAIQQRLAESGRNLEHLICECGPSPLSQFAQQEQLERLCAAIDALPELQREAVQLRHLEQRSVAEVARIMKRSTASVAGLLRRGMHELREALQSHGESR